MGDGFVAEMAEVLEDDEPMMGLERARRDCKRYVTGFLRRRRSEYRP